MLGVVLAIGPIVGGLFSKVASGKQMIDRFAPHMEADARDGTVPTSRRCAWPVAVETIYAEQGVATGRFPGLDAYRREASAIDEHATSLLDLVIEPSPITAVSPGSAGSIGSRSS